MTPSTSFPVLTIPDMRRLRLYVPRLHGGIWDEFPGRPAMDFIRTLAGRTVHLARQAPLSDLARRLRVNPEILNWLRLASRRAEVRFAMGPFTLTARAIAKARFLRVHGHSVREIALACEVHETTTQKHLKRLAEAGMLTLHEST